MDSDLKSTAVVTEATRNEYSTDLPHRDNDGGADKAQAIDLDAKNSVTNSAEQIEGEGDELDTGDWVVVDAEAEG